MARRHSRGAIGVLLAAAIALVFAGCALALGGAPGGPAHYVQRSGQQLTLDGKPFRFVGFNLYDGAASDVYSCTPANRLDDTELADVLHDAKTRAGATVVRFWAYQTYTDGGTDFSGVDRLIAAAKKQGMKVLPVLEDGPGYCSTGQDGVPLEKADGGKYYTDGYQQPYGSATLSLSADAKVMAEHYRDDPTVLGWSIFNEAETTQRDARGRSALVDAATDLSAIIHAADPNHLVTMGTQSNGAPGSSGSDFAAVYGVPGIDFTEAHDYAFYGDDAAPMPGAAADGSLPAAGSSQCRARDAKIACAFAIARKLDKPIVVGEAGINASDAAGRRQRAVQLGAKMRAAFDAGAAGYLVWHLDVRPSFDGDGYAVLPSTDDPLFTAMRKIVRDGYGGPAASSAASSAANSASGSAGEAGR